MAPSYGTSYPVTRAVSGANSASDLLGGVNFPNPGVGNGYANFDNTSGILANHPNAAVAAQPRGLILLSVTDVSGAGLPFTGVERPLIMAGGA